MPSPRRKSSPTSPKATTSWSSRRGAYAGKALDADGVKALASIPSKEVLLAQLLGLMQSPVSRMARVLAAIAEKRGGPAPNEPLPADGRQPSRRLQPARRSIYRLIYLNLGNQNGIR